MKKRGVAGYLVLAIVLAMFSVISFAPPFKMNGTFWIAYVSGVIAILFQIYVFKISFEKGKDAKSKFYGFPIASIGVVYLVIQLVISIVEMVVAKFIPSWISVVLNVIILAMALLGCIAADMMRNEIVKQDIEIKTDVSNMRDLQSMSASIVGMCKDNETKKELQEVADEFKYSDPVTSESTAELENELKTMVGEIQRAVIDGDMAGVSGLCVRVKGVLAERNRVCKRGK